MVGYTQKDKKGEKTVDNWLIRSWDDNALQPGRTTHSFKLSAPQGTSEIQVEASLTYQVGDSVTPMIRASQKFSVAQQK
ncbi:MAG: hypothetical protein HY644_12125 [Acidobacteria bacterium]|nr:hypothetical protein [Acidobacteriota bacterium]